MRKILPTVKKSKITLYTHHALPFQIPFITKETESWFMSCFINVFYRYEFPTFYDYTDYNVFYRDIMYRDSLTYSTALTLNSRENFFSFIGDEKYIYAWVDQYYISATPYYQIEHNIHPILIYGYDSSESVYLCRCFTAEKSVYDANVKCDEYHEALYNAGKNNDCINDDDVFCLFHVKPEVNANFIFENFIGELTDYTYGKGCNRGFYFSKNELFYDLEDYNKNVFGIQVTEIFLNFLKNGGGRCVDYRLLHMICENKRLIAERLQYIVNTQCIISDSLFSLVEQYKQLSQRYEQARLVSIKVGIKENKGDFLSSFLLDKEYTEELYFNLKKLYEEEYILLKKIILELGDCFVQNKFREMRIYKAEEHSSIKRISFKESRFIKNLVVFCTYSICRGKILIDNQEIQTNNFSMCGRMFHVFKINREINLCEFHSDTYDSEDNICFYVLGDSTSCATYEVSSTFSGENENNITVDNLVKLDNSFWCPEIMDNNPYIEINFNKDYPATAVFIHQHPLENRVEGIEIYTFSQKDKWKLVAIANGLLDKERIRVDFTELKAERFRIYFTNLVADQNGYSIPNITYAAIL